MRELIHKITKSNILLELEDGELKVFVKDDSFDPSLIEEIRSNKQALIDFLKENSAGDEASSEIIPQEPVKEDYAISYGQRRIWLLSQVGHASVGYNMPAVFEFQGILDLPKFEKAILKLIDRHEVLRTSFHENEEGEVRQRIHSLEEIGFKLEVEDYSGRLSEASRIINQEIATPFDLADAPLFKVKLLKVEADKYLFSYVIHHIISDGWSMGVLIRDILDFYNDTDLQKEKLRIQYKDFSAWQNRLAGSESSKSAMQYWSENLKALPVLNFPLDFSRLNVKTYNGGFESFTITQETSGKLKKLLSENNATLFMGVLALVNGLVHRYSGQKDFGIGTPVAGRNNTDTENQLGLFVNTLVLRSKLEESDSFTDLLAKAKKQVMDGFNHQNLPFDLALDQLDYEKDPSRNPLFDIMVVLQNAAELGQDIRMGELIARPKIEKDQYFSKFDLTFSFTDTPEGIFSTVEYNSDLFEKETALRLLGYLNALLELVVDNPGKPILKQDFLSSAEREELLIGVNDTQVPYPDDCSIAAVFEEVAQKVPGNIAFTDKKGELTYDQLNKLSNQFARYLVQEKGCKTNDRIAVCLPKSIEYVQAVLSVMKLGASFVPVDMETPKDRLDFMLKDTGSRLLIDLHVIEEFNQARSRYSDANLNIEKRGDEEVTVLYTSGSTGEPKGCAITHRNVMRVVKSSNFATLDERTSLLSTSEISFDACVLEVWAPLLNGGRLSVIGKEDLLEPKKLKDQLLQNGVNTIWFTVGFFNQLVESDVTIFAGLETLMVGGDRLSPVHIGIVKEKYPSLKIVNGYGPTEATVFSLTYEVTEVQPGRSVPIGKPISNSSVYILDENLSLLPKGAVGEIFVGGDGVALGYINQEALTREKFIPNPFKEGDRLYKTGDLGKWLSSGNVEFLGRKDNQVKIRGFRVEPGEVEKHITDLEEVENAVVIVESKESGYHSLVAYLVADKKLSYHSIRSGLLAKMPEYMVPNAFVQVRELPLNSRGKVNRRELQEMEGELLSDDSVYQAPVTDEEKSISEVWKTVLKRDQIGANDNFFALGGDSIKSIQIASRLKAYGFKVKVSDILRFPVLSELATRLKPLSRSIPQEKVAGEVLLTPIQHRFFTYGEINHYNQAVLLKLNTRIEPENIKIIFEKILEHHDALRMIYTNVNGTWDQRNRAENVHVSLEVFDLTRSDNGEADITRLSTELQGKMNLEKGNLLNLALFQTIAGDRLLIAVHHLVIDGISWRVLFEDIATLESQLRQGEALTLPLKTDSFQAWANQVYHYSGSARLRAEIPYWHSMMNGSSEKITTDINGSNAYKDIQKFSFSIEKRYVDLMISGLYDILDTSIEIALVAALTRALHECFSMKNVAINMEGHGREEIVGDLDISRTIGWFTAVYPVVFSSENPDPIKHLIAVKDILRTVPNNGFGYGVLKYISKERFEHEPEVTFNYLGDFENAGLNQDGLFSIAPESSGANVSPAKERDSLIEVNAIGTGGSVNVTIAYSGEMFYPETIARLGEVFYEKVVELCEKAREIEHKIITRSDLTLSSVSNEELSAITAEYPSVSDVYELSPLQEGMYFHWLTDKNSGAYINQLNCTVKGRINLAALISSFEKLMERHGVFNTVFSSDFSEVPIQILHGVSSDKKRIKLHDFSSLAAKEEALEALKKEELTRGFDLKHEGGLRLNIIKLDENEFVLMLSFHHILIDGWCLKTIFSDLLAIYHSLANSSEILLPAPKTYKEYILWLRNVDAADSIRYWTEYLSGSEIGETVPMLREKGVSPDFKHLKFGVDQHVYGQLQKLSEEKSVSLNTICQAAWGILLSRYTNKKDVVFGAVVSGRPSSLDGVEDMVGLFINTIPVRVNHTDETDVSGLLQKLHKNNIEIEQHQYIQLADIQSALKERDLFDTLFVFENYPVQEELVTQENDEDDLYIEKVEFKEETNYGINISFFPGESLQIKLVYDKSKYPEILMSQISVHLRNILNELASKPGSSVADIDYATTEEKLQFSTLGINNSKHEVSGTILSVFEKITADFPAKNAVVIDQAACSYQELNLKSNKLASYLINECNIQKGDFVGVSLNPHANIIVSLLGILKCGAIYVPIDPEYPEARQKYMLEDSKCKIVINEEFINSFRSAEVMISDEAPYVNIEPDDLAYVMYTSGSTGEPKGVKITHANVVNLVVQCGYCELSPADVLLATGSMSFDITTFEYWGMLLNGGTLVLASKNQLINPALLEEIMVRNKVNMIHFIPSWFNELTQANISLFGQLEKLIVGGDKVSLWHVNKVKTQFPELQILHAYGPTENTTFSTVHEVEMNAPGLPVGRAIDGKSVYVLDSGLNTVPYGIVGEICVGGAGLSPGYLNKPELTDERFIPNPFDRKTKIYRTGDYGRWNPDGTIDFVGRRDEQVKIRGHRVEPGEIEAVLLSKAAVEEMIVLPLKDSANVFSLTAFYQSAAGLAEEELLRISKAALPHYMIPSRFMKIAELPLNANGKVDRSKLIEMAENDVSTKVGFVKPESGIEAELARIWEDLLQVKELSAHASFWDLGGHSLKAVRLLGKYQKLFNVKLDLSELFYNPTIREQAALIGSRTQMANDEIHPVPPAESYPVSSAQRRLWVLCQFEQGKEAYNMPFRFTYPEALEMDHFKNAVLKVINRHEILRTVFEENESMEIRQKVIPFEAFDFEIKEIDFSDLDDSERACNSYLETEKSEPFDLGKGSLLRAGIIHTRKENIFYYTIHHIISDMWSMEVLYNEISLFYEAERKGQQADIPELTIQYKDYAAWQLKETEKQTAGSHLEFWKQQFSDTIPVLNLPTQYPRPEMKTFNGKALSTSLSMEDSQALKSFSGANGGTLFMGLLSVWNVLLSKYSGQKDIVVGTPVAGREHVDLQNQIGFYVNMLALRNNIEPGDSFERFFQKVKENTIKCYQHQAYPFDHLVDELELARDTSRSPLFDVLFTLENNSVNNTSGTETEQISDRGAAVAKFDIDLVFEEKGDLIELRLNYNPDLFAQDFMEQMIRHYKQLLAVLLSSPGKQLDEILYLTKEEEHTLIHAHNATAKPILEGTFLDHFRNIAEQHPDKTAVCYEAECITYGELHLASNQIAHYLHQYHDVKPSMTVGLNIENACWRVALTLGILKSGAAFVPVSPDYSAQRIDYIKNNSQLKTFIEQSELEAFFECQHEMSVADPAISVTPSDLAYIIYTSGSTGNPKGVMIEHHSLLNICNWHKNTYQVTAQSRGMLFALVGFDAAICELFPYLMSGAALYQISNEAKNDPKQLIGFYNTNKITHSFLPTILYPLLVERSEDLENPITVWVGGEALTTNKVSANINAWNNYGPTESTVVALFSKIAEDRSRARIGNPVDNMKAYILDANLQIQPYYVVGEICLSGEGLARGYINDAKTTAEKYIASPFEQERMYRTGDFGYRHPDGTIFFVGRRDDQVKLRGYRIELGEIEYHLRQIASIHEAIVLVRTNDQDEKELVAFITAADENIAGELRSVLSAVLPGYMIPSHFVLLERFPLTPSKKVDKKALLELNIDSSPEVLEAPRTENERKAVSIWQSVLDRAEIGIQSDFFTLGGQSLKAVRLIGEYHRLFDVKLKIKDIFLNPRLQDQVKLIEASQKKTFDSIRSITQAESYPLSDAQRRLWILSFFEHGGVVYNMPFHAELPEDVEVGKFKSAIRALTDRHEILRTVFRQDANGEPRQWIIDPETFELTIEQIDYSGSENAEALAREYIAADSIKPFNLEQGPLIRVALIELPGNKKVLYYNMHHIISDQRSLEVIFAEVKRIYTQLQEKNLADLPELPIQYKDFSHWQQEKFQSDSGEQLRSFWKDYLKGELSVFELQGAKPRPKHKTFKGEGLETFISKELTIKAKAYTSQHKGSLFLTFLGAWNVLCSRYTGSGQVIVGTPVEGRSHPDLRDQIGFYVNMLAIRNEVNLESSFDEFFTALKDNVLNAFEHQDYAFDRLVEELKAVRDTSRNPVFDVLLTMENPGDLSKDALLPGEITQTEASFSKFDLDITFREVNNQVQFAINYNADIYTQALVKDLMQHYVKMLESLLDFPDKPMYQLDYLLPDEKKKLLEEENFTGSGYPDQSIIELFDLQVLKTPEKEAVVFEDKRLTYKALSDQSIQLAAYLDKKYALEKEELVGVKLHRGVDFIISILAILRAGGAYVPIDADYPEERINLIIQDSKLRVVIDSDELNQFENTERADVSEVKQKQASGTDLMYVMYTSGSTGVPKGVLIAQKSVVRLVKNANFYNWSEEDTLLSTGIPSFDATSFEYWGPLLNGGKLVICKKEDLLDPVKLEENIKINAVSVMWFTVGWFNELITTRIGLFSTLNTIIVGGDRLTEHHIYKLRETFQQINIINGYGPTENTTFSLTYSVSGDSGSIPVGKPISSSTAYILDKYGAPVPYNVVGEICLGGAGLARGYLNNPELTRQKFVENSFVPDEIIYKTGDLGYRLKDGNIMFVGRNDLQVKINGYRIELGELEEVLLKHNNIQGVVVDVQQNNRSEKELIVYYTSLNSLNNGELRNYLKGKVPDFMLPSRLILIEEFPLNENGKVDKNRLRAMDTGDTGPGAGYIAPENKIQKELVQIVAGVLELDVQHIGIHDNFFDLGGNSIKMVRIANQINNVFSTEIKVVTVFEYPNIAALAKHLSTGEIHHQEEAVDDMDDIDQLDEIIDFMDEDL